MVIRIFKCKRCGGEWASRQEHPIACSVCKSTYWDKDYKSDATKAYGNRIRINKMIVIK